MGFTLFLTSCTTVPARDSENETLILKTWSCFWRTCPTYTITVTPTDDVILETFEATPFLGKKTVHATPSELARFRQILDRHRPLRNVDLTTPKQCKDFWTDQSGISAYWMIEDTEAVHIEYYGGCDPEKHRGMSKDLWSAYKALSEVVPLVEEPEADLQN